MQPKIQFNLFFCLFLLPLTIFAQDGDLYRVAMGLGNGTFEQTFLEVSGTATSCPYKGDASFWSVTVDGETAHDVAWGYRTPLPESEAKGEDDGPLTLAPGRTLTQFHAFYDHGRVLPLLAARDPGPELWISEGDAGARGLADGDAVRVFNPRGSFETRARVARSNRTCRSTARAARLSPARSWTSSRSRGSETWS